MKTYNEEYFRDTVDDGLVLSLDRQVTAYNEEYFRALVDSVTDYAICHLDRDGHVNSWNLGAEWVGGFQADEILGRHFASFYPAEAASSGRPAQALARAMAEGRFRDEIQLVRKGGTSFWADVLITPLQSSPETAQGFTLVMSDITARRKMEAERERKIQELQGMLNNVKILSGLVPICALCKKVRDYTGQWHPLEAYLREHSEVTLTHEFCDDCSKHI